MALWDNKKALPQSRHTETLVQWDPNCISDMKLSVAAWRTSCGTGFEGMEAAGLKGPWRKVKGNYMKRFERP